MDLRPVKQPAGQLTLWFWHSREKLSQREGFGGILEHSVTEAKGADESKHGKKAKNKSQVEYAKAKEEKKNPGLVGHRNQRKGEFQGRDSQYSSRPLSLGETF